MERGVSRLFVGALLSVVLVVTVVTPVAADEVEPTPVEVPPLQSEPYEVPASTTPIGDFTDVEPVLPAVVGKLQHHPRPPAAPTAPTVDIDAVRESDPEVTEQTEFTNVYDLDDGTTLTEVGLEPLNARDDSGDWVPVDTRVSRQPDGSLSTDAHPLDPSFAPQADADGAFSIDRGGYQIEFTLEDAAASDLIKVQTPRKVTLGDTLMYRDVFDGVDLRYDLTKGGVKESLLLSEAPDRGDTQWAWHIEANALTPSVDKFGVVNFTDRYGKVQFHIPAPVMWDSSGVKGESEPAMTTLDTRVRKDGDGWLLTLSADYGWLSDPAREYPVTVDPTVYSGQSSTVAYKSDGAWRTDGVHVGNSRSGGDTWWRTVVKYDYTALDGKHLIGAGLYLDYYDGYEGASSGGVYSAGCYGYGCASEFLSGYTIGTQDTWAQDVMLGTRYAQWAAARSWDSCLLISGDGGSSYSYKALGTTMGFLTTDFPSVASIVAPSPADGAVHASVMPTFNVTGNDPAGTGLSYSYKIGTTANVDASAFYTSTWGTDRDIKDEL